MGKSKTTRFKNALDMWKMVKGEGFGEFAERVGLSGMKIANMRRGSQEIDEAILADIFKAVPEFEKFYNEDYSEKAETPDSEMAQKLETLRLEQNRLMKMMEEMLKGQKDLTDAQKEMRDDYLQMLKKMAGL